MKVSAFKAQTVASARISLYLCDGIAFKAQTVASARISLYLCDGILLLAELNTTPARLTTEPAGQPLSTSPNRPSINADERLLREMKASSSHELTNSRTDFSTNPSTHPLLASSAKKTVILNKNSSRTIPLTRVRCPAAQENYALTSGQAVKRANYLTKELY